MLTDQLEGRDIILASGSPRRKLLLNALGINFRTVKPNADEKYPSCLGKEQIALYLAGKKARTVLKQEHVRKDSIIIASDTIVCLEDEVLNKPANRDEAMAMLKKLSGRSHYVITAVCIATTRKMKDFFSETRVNFAILQDREIEYYVDTCKPFDKAGSYGIQEWIGYIGIESIEGSYFNVMGLPVQRLYTELKMFLDDEHK